MDGGAQIQPSWSTAGVSVPPGRKRFLQGKVLFIQGDRNPSWAVALEDWILAPLVYGDIYLTVKGS